METYVHNPEIYRKHFIGYGLDGFSGARIQQRGRGVGQWWRKAKRYTIVERIRIQGLLQRTRRPLKSTCIARIE